jgi:hypothetical protein
MIHILFGLALIVAVVAGLGFYLGWFHFSSGNDSEKAHITASVDRGRTPQDKD